MNDKDKQTFSSLYISHGGGPLPLLGEPSHREMVDGLKGIASQVRRPSAVVVVSAHWEEERVTVSSDEKPALLYDYTGFPKEAYEIDYAAPGSPSLAREIVETLKKKGIEAGLAEGRGLDHGVFVPMKILYPAADIPCVQLSLVSSLSAAEHIRIGMALRGLRDKNVLVLGSGFSFHNMKAFFSPPTDEIRSMNESFDQWLLDTCSSEGISEKERAEKLVHWDQAPSARFCHPREEHLLPLHVCYGAAQVAAREVFSWNIMGKAVSSFLW